MTKQWGFASTECPAEREKRRTVGPNDYRKEPLRAIIENPFRVFKQPFDYQKVRLIGLANNSSEELTKLWLVRMDLISWRRQAEQAHGSTMGRKGGQKCCLNAETRRIGADLSW